MRTIVASAALALSLLPAAAQQPGGTIVGTFEGQDVSWSINAMRSDFSGDDTYRAVSIMGWKGSQPAGLGQIMIGFELRQDGTELPEIRLLTPAGAPDYYGNEDTGAIVEITSVSENNGFLSLSGTLNTRLGSSDDHGKTLDMTKPAALELTFEGVVEVLGH